MKKLNKLKQVNGRFQEADEAAVKFSRQGLELMDVLKRTQDALILSRLAGIDSDKSVNSLTSAIESFK